MQWSLSQNSFVGDSSSLWTQQNMIWTLTRYGILLCKAFQDKDEAAYDDICLNLVDIHAQSLAQKMRFKWISVDWPLGHLENLKLARSKYFDTLRFCHNEMNYLWCKYIIRTSMTMNCNYSYMYYIRSNGQCSNIIHCRSQNSTIKRVYDCLLSTKNKYIHALLRWNSICRIVKIKMRKLSMDISV